jgi:hypothetical protein
LAATPKHNMFAAWYFCHYGIRRIYTYIDMAQANPINECVLCQLGLQANSI